MVKDRKDIGRTGWDILMEFFREISWPVVVRILILALLLALLGIPIISLYKCFHPELFPYKTRSETRYFLVPANKLWVNSGITLEPNQTIDILVSGQINLAIHRLVDAANTDDPPSFRWCGPEGLHIQERHLYQKRRGMLVAPEVNAGSLLMYRAPDCEVIPKELIPGVHNPRIEGIEVVGRSASFKNKTDERQRIYFTVNDKIIRGGKEGELAYAGISQEEVNNTYGLNPDGSPKYLREELVKKWKELISEGYWTVWFDDNVGQFLLEVKIR